ncbi:MAG TPA: hypothetical protein VM433_11475 [Mycobacteriales bacterium]|nr:hypothetical protein [Mycobacteriales bacterium]
MKSRPVVLASAALLALAALPATAALSTSAAPSHSDNLALVATDITGPGGTDIEFFSRTLTSYKTSADGDLLTGDAPVERHFALVGNQTSGAKIVDITDPEAPFIASGIRDCTVGQGDPQVNAEGTLATIAYQTSGACRTEKGDLVRKGSAIVDLRDPYDPKVIGGAPETQGSHNNTLHPGGRYLYISTSALTPTNAPNTRIPVYDLQGWESWESLAGPFQPRLVQNFMVPGNGPHDIRFSDDGKRAYFAGVSAYWIVNTEDPEKPSIVSTIVPPGGTIGHDTLVTPDKRFLFLGDEAGGGATYPCPGGAVYVYDLTDERAPLMLGAVQAGGGPVVGRNLTDVPGSTRTGGCTSHVMELNPDKKSFTIAWYVLGTRVFDFSSFYNADGTPKPAAGIAAAWGQFGVGVTETAYMVPDRANTWSAKQYDKVPGYIFSDDINLGLYVSKIK